MTGDIQLAEERTIVGYTKETTDGTDPLDGGSGDRIRWPGYVQNITLTENFGHLQLRPTGSGIPDPLTIIRTMQEYTLDIEWMPNEPFSTSGADEIFSTICGPVGTLISHGVVSGGPFQVGETITGGTSSATGTVLVVQSGSLLYTPTAGTMQTAEVITGGTSSATATTTSGPDDGTVLNRRALPPYTVEWGEHDPSPPGSGSPVSFQKLSGCISATHSIEMRPDRPITIRTTIIGRIHTPATTETVTSGVSISDLTHSTLRPAHWNDITFEFRDVPGGTLIDTLLMEMDIVIDNDVFRLKADGSGLNTTCTIAQDRTVTFNIRTAKIGSEKVDISRADPSTDAGTVDINVLVNQSSGWFMELDLPTSVLADRNLGNDTKFNEESFAGVHKGAITLDMASS